MKKTDRNKKGRFKTEGKLKKHIIRVTLEEKEMIKELRKMEKEK